MTRLSRIVLLVALGLAVAFLGFHRLALTDLIFGKGDAYNYFTPLWAARDAALRAGQLPLWTDSLFMGAPLLADSQLGTFYPPNWLTVGLPAWTSLKISVFLHVAWAAIGAYLLARRALGVGMAAAVVAAGAFALGGYVGAHAEQINQLQGIAWMPWAFLSFQVPVSSRQFKTASSQLPAAPVSTPDVNINQPASAGFERISRRVLTPGANAGEFTPGASLLDMLHRIPPLAAVLALIALSGHTQTLFITGVGLGIFALVPARRESTTDASHRTTSRYRRFFSALSPRPSALFSLFVASLLALVLAAVQLLPTLELTGLSNRQGGFTQLSAMAFSWQPNLAARGLLPSLDGQVFGEYVAYLGVAGLALALWGVVYGGARCWPWLVVAVAGVVLAFGLYNPLYWPLAGLPGFNFFRVPARWLVLFALGGAMLAALGAETLIERAVSYPRRGLVAVLGVLAALAILAVWRSPAAALEIDGEARPTLPTLALWLSAGVLFAAAVLLRDRIPRRAFATALFAVTLGELAIAAANMPHRDLVDPMAATDPRLTANWLAASSQLPTASIQQEQGQNTSTEHTEDTERTDGDASSALHSPLSTLHSPLRFLSISLGYFDTYDHAGLLDRYARLGMTERAAKAGLTAAKNKEILAPNFPLLYGVASADGFGGGLLPTVYYTAFTSLILPDGTPRTIDGRLREVLARPECFGACVPERRWLDLMGVGALVLDKTYDRFYDDVQFDVGLSQRIDASQPYALALDAAIAADELHLLVEGEGEVSVEGDVFTLVERRAVDDGLTLLRFAGEPAQRDRLVLRAAGDFTLRGATLVDTRTGAFSMLPLGAWRKALSSDIKLYQSTAALPPAFSIEVVTVVPDDWDGSEAALRLMREPLFDPLRDAVLHGAPDALEGDVAGRAQTLIVSRTGTRTEYTVDVTGGEAVLLLNDAYFPGWTATIDGQPAPLYRADVMFRAVAVPEGRHTLVVEYRPPWLQPLLAFGAAVWIVFGLVWLAIARLTKAS